MDARYRFGIEEEYFLADAVTRDTPQHTQAYHDALRARIPSAERELLAAQVEVATSPSDNPAAARAQLMELRAGLAEIGKEHGLLVLASGTQPLARWARQRQTKKQRYDRLMQQMQMLGQRNVVCGMHVHVEVPRPSERVDLMNRMLPFTPLLMALSASSPFWQGRDTGLAAYRLSVWGEMPRTGLPDLFEDEADYERYVAAMTRSGAITDASFLWWTLRPSVRYPTLELRVADSCTRLDDTMAIAALYRCLVRLLDRSPSLNRGQSGAARAITAENLWRAQRDGIRAAFLDTDGGTVPFRVGLDSILSLVGEDAAALGCEADLDWLRTLAETGTSSDRQLAIFAGARGNARQALSATVDWIAAATAGTAR
ncbi:carboxylate-amine ligase [Plastoroseomonas arctica]|uniref:Putative glutamate--cysteine ligase 2 n=1 Tax=Plastoroseomonas arctica TaxID=1509237 RepID=A0AAF1JVJ4_9PROT|nr:carboxylate-amine ligase [Plastoroseomonas arctica]MBR0654625.1 carboxylate-amine ligase [Plastoroseomonas arctica]